MVCHFHSNGYSLQGKHLIMPPSCLCSGSHYARSQLTDHETHEELILRSPAPQTWYTFTDKSKLLVEVTLDTRWAISITSTHESPFSVHVTLDPSKKPLMDIRCIDAVDLQSSHNDILVAIGAGRFIYMIHASLAHERQADWCIHSEQCPSDVMCVAICRPLATLPAHVLCGLRSGAIHGMYMGLDHSWRSESIFSFVSSGALCHVQFIHDTFFVAAYTNGDLVMGDYARMHDAPIRHYVGHRNKFMQGLVSTIQMTMIADNRDSL